MSENLIIEDATLLRGRFKNFEGREQPYNREGVRNFGVAISDELAADLEARGWPVRYLKPLSEEDEPKPWLKVSINLAYKDKPEFWLVTSRGRRLLDDSDVKMLDYAEITRWDLTINPYHWEIEGPTGGKGIKPMLKTVYATLFEDELTLRYSDVPIEE